MRLNEFFVVKLTEDKQEDLAGNEVRGKKGKLAIRFDDALFSHFKKKAFISSFYVLTAQNPIMSKPQKQRALWVTMLKKINGWVHFSEA